MCLSRTEGKYTADDTKDADVVVNKALLESVKERVASLLLAAYLPWTKTMEAIETSTYWVLSSLYTHCSILLSL